MNSFVPPIIKNVFFHYHCRWLLPWQLGLTSLLHGVLLAHWEWCVWCHQNYSPASHGSGIDQKGKDISHISTHFYPRLLKRTSLQATYPTEWLRCIIKIDIINLPKVNLIHNVVVMEILSPTCHVWEGWIQEASHVYLITNTPFICLP